MKLALRAALLLTAVSPAVLDAQTPVDPSQIDPGQGTRPTPTQYEPPRHLPVVNVTFVDSSMAYAPGEVAILGDNLQFVTAVRIGDEPVTVTFQDKHKILIQPGARDPGFEKLNLVVGNRKIQAPIEFTPSLKAEWVRPDRFYGWPAARLRLTLHPGATGTYMILYSSRRLMTGTVYPGTYHCELLDMTAAQSGMLTCGAVSGDQIVKFPLTIPLYPRPSLFAQAYCVSGLHSCYSNLVAPMFDMTPSP